LRSHHGEVSTTIHIECRAVRRTTFGEGDTTSCIVVDGSIAVGTEGSSVENFKKEVQGTNVYTEKGPTQTAGASNRRAFGTLG
jgi:hypothetical protein